MRAKRPDRRLHTGNRKSASNTHPLFAVKKPMYVMYV